MQTERIIKHLEQTLEHIEMKHCNFGVIHLNPGEAPLPKDEKEVTDFIRNRTRLWRKTWFIGELKLALELLRRGRNKKLKKGRK